MKGMNLNYWAINIGFSVAAVLAGFLAHAPHMTIFLLAAGAQLVTGTMIFALVPETKPHIRVGTAPAAKGSIRDVLTDRVFMTFVLLNTGLWTIIEASKLIPIAMHDRGLDPADFGKVIAVNGVMIVLGQLFVPRLLRGRTRAHVLAAAALLVGLGMGAVAIAGSIGALMLTVVIWTAGEMINAPVNGTYLADLSQAEMRGRYQGVASMSFTLANFISPVLGGVLLDHAPPATLWIACAGLGVIVAIGQIATGPARDRRVAALRTQQEVSLATVS